MDESSLRAEKNRLYLLQRDIQSALALCDTVLAEKVSGFAVGDLVKDGKGRTCILTHLSVPYGKSVRFRGSIIKKNGVPGPEIELIWEPFEKIHQEK